MFTSFLVPSHEGLFPKSYFRLKSAKVYFREISQAKESGVKCLCDEICILLFHDNNPFELCYNKPPTSIYMEYSEESFKKWRNS